MNRLLREADTFLFAPCDPRQFALLRIGIGLMIFYYLCELYPYRDFHYSREGWLANIRDLELINSGDGSLLFYLQGPGELHIFWLLALLAALGFALGCFTKSCALLSYVALLSIWNKNPLVLDGDDALLRIMLFYLALSACGEVWSIDAWRRHRETAAVSIWPLRLMQWQLALLYVISGWVKFYSPAWDDGSILATLLVHPDYARWNAATLLQFPEFRTFLRWLAHLIRGWEVLFPLLLLHPTTRKLSLAFGILFHSGLWLCLKLRGFAPLMLWLYLAFIPPAQFTRQTNLLQRRLLQALNAAKSSLL